MSRLQESLEAYVRGELLEGADAYHCDKCNKKVCIALLSSCKSSENLEFCKPSKLFKKLARPFCF